MTTATDSFANTSQENVPPGEHSMLHRGSPTKSLNVANGQLNVSTGSRWWTSLGEVSIHVPREHEPDFRKENPDRVPGYRVCEWNNINNVAGGSMKKFMAAIVIAGIVLAGCSTSGGSAPSQKDPPGVTYAPPKIYAVDPSTIATFKVGVTTMDQVEGMLGKPLGAVRTPSGNQVIAYAKTRTEDVNNDRTPETGTALPKRHKIRYATMLAFDPQGHWINSWTRVDDLGDASPSALGHFDAGDILTNQDGMP
jgi:hypothetical protein